MTARTVRAGNRQLTATELHALHLVAQGKTNVEISAALGHPGGVHVGRLAVYGARRKLGARNRAHLVALGYQAGLLGGEGQ